MGNWIAGDPTLVAQVLKISAAYTPPPPEGFISPVTWGNDAEVIAASPPPAFRPPTSALPATAMSLPATCRHGVPRHLPELSTAPTMNAFAAAEAAGRTADTARRARRAVCRPEPVADARSHPDLPPRFLRVTVSVPDPRPVAPDRARLLNPRHDAAPRHRPRPAERQRRRARRQYRRHPRRPRQGARRRPGGDARTLGHRLSARGPGAEARARRSRDGSASTGSPTPPPMAARR